VYVPNHIVDVVISAVAVGVAVVVTLRFYVVTAPEAPRDPRTQIVFDRQRRATTAVADGAHSAHRFVAAVAHVVDATWIVSAA
jgi:hypothetical protein